ncbi:MAG TPA: S-layer homology domain-containing protein, partial [Anaerolineales bacterium]|nr:S-layer homology domain-containing protein [Anaerolineales bacterium]
YVDGVPTSTLQSDQVDATTWNNATNHGFFILLNLAMGGGFPNGVAGGTTPTAATISGGSLLVDYVRVYYLDVPVVHSILRASSNPAFSASVSYAVTFSESVTGVDTSDFLLTGIADASVINVSGSGMNYMVLVDTGSTDGILRLDVVDNNTIKNTAGNALGGTSSADGNFNSGEVYTVKKNSTFGDTPSSHWAWQYIERLYSAAITGGCSTSPLSYCPESEVTRAQMAVFLEKGIHYPISYSPSNVSSTFNDTTGHWAEDWIEALKNDGITSGCAIGLYCPDSSVTRAQMAVFLLKAKHGSSYTPPNVTTTFGDIAGHWAEDWIEQLAAEGITSGCASGLYCPESPVTRAQMAVFLVKAFGLP